MSRHLLDFSQKLAAIMPEIGSDRLPSLLISMLKSLVPFDNAVILHYRRGDNVVSPRNPDRWICEQCLCS